MDVLGRRGWGAIQRRGQSGSSGSDKAQREGVVLEGRIIEGELIELGEF